MGPLPSLKLFGFNKGLHSKSNKQRKKNKTKKMSYLNRVESYNHQYIQAFQVSPRHRIRPRSRMCRRQRLLPRRRRCRTHYRRTPTHRRGGRSPHRIHRIIIRTNHAASRHAAIDRGGNSIRGTQSLLTGDNSCSPMASGRWAVIV